MEEIPKERIEFSKSLKMITDALLNIDGAYCAAIVYVDENGPILVGNASGKENMLYLIAGLELAKLEVIKKMEDIRVNVNDGED